LKYSYSSLGKMQVCERKFALHYREGLRKAGPIPFPLLRGQAWHAVMAAQALQIGLYEGSLLQEIPERIRVIDGVDAEPTISSIMDALKEWETAQESEYLDAMREEYGDLLSARMWDLWIRFNHSGNVEKDFGKPLLIEFEWTRTLPNGLEAVGVTDLVYLDPETNQVVVRDWKLNASWPQTASAIEDLVNSQNHFNAWGVADSLRDLSGDKELVPSAVEYARARFKKPATPAMTKGTKNSPPRLAKSTSDFDAYTYREWCREQELPVDQAVYDELATQRDKWFRFTRKPLLYNVYSQHVISAARQAERAETITTEESIPVYGSHCGFCEFSSLCRADLVGGRQPYDEVVLADYGLRKRAENAVH